MQHLRDSKLFIIDETLKKTSDLKLRILQDYFSSIGKIENGNFLKITKMFLIAKFFLVMRIRFEYFQTFPKKIRNY
jgi:hypothetical protein